MTGWGWVGAGGAGPKVRAECAVPEGRDAELSGIKVGDGDGDGDEDKLSVLAVEAVWGSCTIFST